jgi:beta-galactosidase
VDVRWVALTNGEGVGLAALGMPLLSVGAKHFTKKDMEEAEYTFQIPRHPEVFLNLDLAQMGAGGIDSWSMNAFPMQPYRLPADKPYSFKYRLTPVAGDFSAKIKERF